MRISRLLAILGAALALAGAARAQPAVKIGVLTDMGSGVRGRTAAPGRSRRRAWPSPTARWPIMCNSSPPTTSTRRITGRRSRMNGSPTASTRSSTCRPRASRWRSMARPGGARKLVFFSTTINDRITEEECNGYGIAWGMGHLLGRPVRGAVAAEGRLRHLVRHHAGRGRRRRRVGADTPGRPPRIMAGKWSDPSMCRWGQADWSAYMLQAQASHAKAALFGSGGSDLVNGLKQAREFGLPQSGHGRSARCMR